MPRLFLSAVNPTAAALIKLILYTLFHQDESFVIQQENAIEP